jgi:hypothetical protein
MALDGINDSVIGTVTHTEEASVHHNLSLATQFERRAERLIRREAERHSGMIPNTIGDI